MASRLSLCLFCSSLLDARVPFATRSSERNPAVQRPQQLQVMQGDHDGVDQSDVGNCSSDAGMEAFLREAAEHGQVDYFQGIHSSRAAVQRARGDKLDDDPGLTRTSGGSPLLGHTTYHICTPAGQGPRISQCGRGRGRWRSANPYTVCGTSTEIIESAGTIGCATLTRRGGLLSGCTHA